VKSAVQVIADINAWKNEHVEKADLMCRIAEDEIGWPYAWGATGQRCTVSNRQARMNNPKIGDGDKNLIKKRCQVLNGSKSSCDGCKYYPDGNYTLMFDCIGFINQLEDYAGVPHYGGGCTTAWNHADNWSAKGKLKDMPQTVCLVFQQYPGNDKKMQHIGLYMGNGYVIHCSVEVKKQKLSEYPWTHYAIPKGIGGDVPVSHKTIKKGSVGPDVVECQEDLIKLGYDLSPYGADGKFGAKTEVAVKEFQTSVGLKADGIVGPRTWEALDNAVGPEPGPTPTPTLYTVTIPHVTAEQAEAIKQQYPDATVTEERG